MPRLTYTLTRGLAIFDCEVWYRCVPAYAGATDGRRGPKTEPDWPACIEIEWIEGPDGTPIETTPEEDAAIVDAANEHASDMHDWPEPSEDFPP